MEKKPIAYQMLYLGVIIAATALILVSTGFQRADEFDLRPGKKLIVKGKMFDAGSSTLAPKEIGWFERLAEYLKKRPNLYMEIIGYTDNRGDSTVNKRLSEARANAVKSYLVGRGVAAARIKAFGKGADKPIASNDDEEGRAQNRRVEIIATSPFTERPLTSANGEPLQPEGRITALLPPVRALAPWEIDWRQARLNDPIYEYQRLETGEQGRAEVTFSNKHRIQVAERSLVVLYGKDASALEGKPQEQLRLVQGGLWVKLKSQREANALRISTGNGELSLGRSSAKIEIDSARRALVSVHLGTVALRNASSDSVVNIPENYGARMAENAPPEQPRPLPPIPELLTPKAADSLYAGIIDFQWRKRSAQARFEVADAITFEKPIYAVVGDRDSARVRLPEGEWYVKLSAIDSLGLESRMGIYLLTVAKERIPDRFYILTFALFLGGVGSAWWSGVTRQNRLALWSAALFLCGIASFFFLRW